jgi:putative transposase
MTKNTVIDFAKPSDFSPDPLTDLLRAGAQELLATAVRAEVSEFMAGHVHLLDDEGRQRLVRHGFLPEREVMTIARQAIVVLSRLRSGLSTHLGSLSFKGQGAFAT